MSLQIHTAAHISMDKNVIFLMCQYLIIFLMCQYLIKQLNSDSDVYFHPASADMAVCASMAFFPPAGHKVTDSIWTQSQNFTKL